MILPFCRQRLWAILTHNGCVAIRNLLSFSRERVKGANLESVRQAKKHLLFPFQCGSLLSLVGAPYVSFLLLKCTAAAVKCKWLIRKIVRVAVAFFILRLRVTGERWWLGDTQDTLQLVWQQISPRRALSLVWAPSLRGSFSFILAHSASYLKCARRKRAGMWGRNCFPIEK